MCWIFLFLTTYFSLSFSVPKNIYVNYNESNVPSCKIEDLSECGDNKKPFSSIMQMFYFIDLNSESLITEYNELNIFFLSPVYIVDSFNVSYYLGKLNQTGFPIWQVFKKISGLQINMRPYDLNKTVLIAIKTIFFSFQINDYTLNLQNINFNGNDIVFRSMTQHPCLYWKIGCCVLFPTACSLIISRYSGSMTHIFEMINDDGIFFISNCQFTNMTLKKCLLVDGISYCSNGFMLLSTQFCYVKIENSHFENISYISFFIGAINQKGTNTFYGQRNFIWKNNTLIKVNWGPFDSDNSTFSLSNMGQASFVDSYFDSIFDFLKISNSFEVLLENNIFIQKTQKSYFESNNYLSISSYFININNNIINDILVYMNLLRFESAVLSIFNLSMSNILYTWEASLIKIFGSNMNLKNLKILLYPISAEFIYTISIQANVLISQNLTIVNQNKNILINIIFQNIQKIMITDCQLTEEGSIIKLSNFAISFFYCNHIMASKLLFYGGVSISISGETKYVFISDSRFSLEEEDSTSLFQFEKAIFIQFKYVFFENFSKKIKWPLIYLNSNNTIIIKKCYFFEITNMQSGGLIHANSQNKIKILESTIFNVKSYDNGGSILIVNENVVILFDNNVINSNTLNSGGFLNAYQSENIIFAKNTSFILGVAADGAGFYLNYNSSLRLENVFFSNNTAAYNGGTIKLNFYSVCFLFNVKILHSSSLETGGVISMFNFNTLILRYCLLENLISESGGVFSLKRNNLIFGSDLVIKNVKAAFTAALLKGDSLNIILFINLTTSNLTTEIGLFVLENNNKFFFLKSKIADIVSSKELISLNTQNLLFFKNSSFMNENQNIFTSFFFFKGNLNLFIFQSSYLNLMLLSFVFAAYENKFYLEKILLKEIVSTYYFMVLQTVEKTLLIIKKVNLFFIKKRNSTNTKSFLFLNVRNSLIFIANFSMHNNFKNLVELGDFYNCKLSLKNVDIFNFNLHPNLQYFKATYCWIIIERFNAINVNFLLNSSYFNVHKSTFSLTDTNEKGILFHLFHEKCFPFSKFLHLKISDSVFVFNKVKSILVLNTDFCDNLIMIKTSFFRNNFASNGPAINALNLKNLLLENNYFIFNRAKCDISSSKGGVFYFETQHNFKYFTFINNTFIKNSANIGGVFYLNGGFPYIDEKEFRKNNKKIENNTALFYGQDFATNTIQFALDEKKILISNLVSGKNYTKCLAFALISDFYGNYAYKSNEIINNIIIKNEMNESISNSDNWLLEDGFLCFKGYLKNKGSSFENIYWYNLKFLSNFSTEILFSYSFRSCKKGERLTNDYICVECPRNFYSFKFSKNEISTCSICGLDLPFFCFGGNNITIKYSYWRKSADSTTILKCPNDDACIGDTRIFDDSTQYDPNLALSKCAKGYTGPLCAICEKGFGFSDKFFCVECTDKVLFVKLSFFFLIQLFFSLFTIYKSLCTALRIHKNPSLTVDTSSTNLLKILSNHAAILIIIFSLNESPLIFNSIFEGNPFNFNLSDKFTLECIFKLLNFEVPFIYSKILITILSPIFILIISILFFQVFFFQKRKKSLKKNKSVSLFEGLYLRDILQPLILIIISLNISHVIRDCLSMFVYQNIGEEDTPDFRLKNDYSVIYDSKSHKNLNFFLALPLLISSSFLFPFLLLLKLWIKKRSQSLYEQKNLLNFAFFFYSYKDNAFYWDIFTFFRRLFIQVAVIFSSNISSQSGKYLVLLLILSFHLITIFLLLKIFPYKAEYKTIHSIEESSLLTLIASTFCFLTIMIFETDKEKFSNYADSLVVIIIIFNLAFYVINFFVYVKSKKYMYKFVKEWFRIFNQKNLLKKISYKKKMDFTRIKLKKISEEKLLDTTNTTYDSGLQKYLRAKDQKNQNLIKKIKALTQKILELNHLKNKSDMKLNFQNLCFNGHFYKTIFKNADFKIKTKYSSKIEKSIIYKFKLFLFSPQAKLNEIKTRICNRIKNHAITLEWNKMKNSKYYKATIEIESACLEVFPVFMIEHLNFLTRDLKHLDFEIPVPFSQLLKKEKIEIVHDDNFDNFSHLFIKKNNGFEFESSKILLRQILVCYEFEYFKKINNVKILLHFTDRQMNKIILYFCLLEKSDKCNCFILNADPLKQNYLIFNNLKKILESF